MHPEESRDKRRKFLRRLTWATACGEGLDGFDLGIISVVIVTIGNDLQLTPLESGLVGASSLIGILVGAPLFGHFTDRWGRQKLFIIDMVIFVIAGFLQAFVPNGAALVVVRLLLGVAIGAEYSIGAPMLAEFSPAQDRGRRLSLLEVFWYVGFLCAVLVGYALVALGVGWREILATSVIPAVATLILRHGLPESPRWLMSKGRSNEALAIVDANLGREFFELEEISEETPRHTQIRLLFHGEQRGRTVFVCLFWACLVAPYFAIFTFAPEVLDSMGLGDEKMSTIATNGVAALGVVMGMFMIEKIGRRQMLIAPFWIQTGALLVVGIWASPPFVVLAACFWAFAFFNSFSANLTAVYPAELFDTSIRTTGVGIAAAASRIGAAIGTWLLPVGLEYWGARACMLIAAAICALGALVSQFMAPETSGKTLIQTSSFSKTE